MGAGFKVISFAHPKSKEMKIEETVPDAKEVENEDSVYEDIFDNSLRLKRERKQQKKDQFNQYFSKLERQTKKIEKVPAQFRDTEYKDLQLKTKLLLSSLQKKDSDQKSTPQIDESSFIISPDLLSGPSSTKMTDKIHEPTPQRHNVIEYNLELEHLSSTQMQTDLMRSSANSSSQIIWNTVPKRVDPIAEFQEQLELLEA